MSSPPGPSARAFRRGNVRALPQVPCFSLTTNDWVLLPVAEYDPPAPQLPADGHDTTEKLLLANRAPSAAAWPGIAWAVPQIPFFSLTAKRPFV